MSALDALPELLDWYAVARRPFPWRVERVDPYSVWIVEVMSQQSTMASVLPYFERWMREFPTLESLAEASEERVLSAWAGLGYYSRARNLHRAARDLVEYRARHGGAWPADPQTWQEFPGVGPYTAAAVAAIALGAAVLPVDGNVIRVLSRVHGVADALNLAADRRRVDLLASEWAARASSGGHGALAQAFMDLGALVCRPGAQARCEICPLRSVCQAFRRKKVTQIPRAKHRKETKKIKLLAIVYRRLKGDGVLLRRIPKGRRLEGQWELPLWEVEDKGFLESIGAKFPVYGPLRHSITHHAYEVWRVDAGDWREKLPAGHDWSASVEPWTTLTRKLLKD